MDHADHVRLLEGGIVTRGGTWGDFGSGRGAFTIAIAELIGPEGMIYSVDKNQAALQEQARAVKRRFSDQQPKIHYIHGDYRRWLPLPALDGAVMANSLHFYEDKRAILKSIHGYLNPHGRLILVEYNTDLGNSWVPFPISYDGWQVLADQSGFERTSLLARVPSSFLGEIYSALSYKIAARDK